MQIFKALNIGFIFTSGSVFSTVTLNSFNGFYPNGAWRMARELAETSKALIKVMILIQNYILRFIY